MVRSKKNTNTRINDLDNRVNIVESEVIDHIFTTHKPKKWYHYSRATVKVSVALGYALYLIFKNRISEILSVLINLL